VDFGHTESQQAVAAAAAEVLDRSRTAVRAPVGPDTWEFAALWKELAQAGLLALALPDWLGGDGLSVLDTAVLLTELGRRAEPGPALATLMLGVLPVTRWAGRDVQRAVLAGVATGDTLLTAAVREPSDPMPLAPATTATLTAATTSSLTAATEGEAPSSDPAGTPLGTVSGTKIGVPYAAEARWVLVPASLATGGAGVVLVDPAAPGVTATRTPSSAGTPEYTLRMDRAPVAHLLRAELDGRDVADLGQLALAGACSLADGLLAGALALTTAHVASRTQFGRPLATFQAVAQQIADISIAARTLHLATLSGCWRLDTGRAAAADLDVAGYWLAEHGPPALRACHHLHGGLGMDVSYPLPRYSALIKDLVRFTGGADYRLDALATRVCD
jgi:3-oxo-4-pregnene-20-carboxyl-CoA dehydrogenase alpha subunit